MPLEALGTNLDVKRKSKLIRDLNDQFRSTLIGGEVLITPGVLDLGNETTIQVLRKVRKFDNFTAGNDPHNEHDFGEVKVNDNRVWFKIDLYDKDQKYGSPDPADPEVTTRVMTILLPEEY